MIVERTRIIVTWDQAGFHAWPGAHDERAYLRERHRHKFHFRLEVDVEHADREIEFHDLLEAAEAEARCFREGAARSCEMMARAMLDWLGRVYGARSCACEVWEDKECGARVERAPP